MEMMILATTYQRRQACWCLLRKNRLDLYSRAVFTLAGTR